VAMRTVGWTFRGPRRFAAAQRLARVALPLLRPWTRGRDLPPREESFRDWWRGR
jgi:hypothetical protein